MIYAISDIHGCIYELKQKMSRVELSGKNRIVFLGDYIDYGEYSFQVEAADMILSRHGDLIFWMECLPDNYETDKQIFVHAGVDEEAGEYWKWGTSDELFLWKFPPSAGRFYKTVIAGHVGTGAKELADDDEYHEVFYDGESHYYIDGGVYKKDGKLLLLAYDEAEDMYYSIQDNGRKIRAGKDTNSIDKYFIKARQTIRRVKSEELRRFK